MGLNQSLNLLNYQDIQYIQKCHSSYILINTLSNNEQSCLISNTLNFDDEEKIINNLIKSKQKNFGIVIYGKNASDDTIIKKYNQLLNLGFTNLYIYNGGLFEWLLLQDIYGFDEFPTTSKTMDILKYKSKSNLDQRII